MPSSLGPLDPDAEDQSDEDSASHAQYLNVNRGNQGGNFVNCDLQNTTFNIQNTDIKPMVCYRPWYSKCGVGIGTFLLLAVVGIIAATVIMIRSSTELFVSHEVIANNSRVGRKIGTTMEDAYSTYESFQGCGIVPGKKCRLDIH